MDKTPSEAFNYEVASKAIDDISLDTFFNFNPAPTVESYPSIQTFLPSFLSFNEKLYKEAKKKFSDTAQEESENDSEGCPIKKNYLVIADALSSVLNKDERNLSDPEKNPNFIPSSLKKKLRRSALKYCHSQCLSRLFQGYFSLCTYHKRTVNSYPEIFDQYLKTIITVFSSMSKVKIKKLFTEISTNQKTFDFYLKLYGIWESTVNEEERRVFLCEL